MRNINYFLTWMLQWRKIAHSVVNRKDVGSSPTWGVKYFLFLLYVFLSSSPRGDETSARRNPTQDYVWGALTSICGAKETSSTNWTIRRSGNEAL